MVEERKIYAYVSDDVINLAKNARENEKCENNLQKMLKVKVGETNAEREAEERIKEQSNAAQSSNRKYLYKEGDIKSVWENSKHTDDEIRSCLIKEFNYIQCNKADIPEEGEVLSRTRGEWLFISYKEGETVEDTRKRAFEDIQRAINYLDYGVKRSKNYEPRTAQSNAIEKISTYMSVHKEDSVSYFLLAAKPRFGKNHALLRSFERLGYKRVLIVSYLPFVFSSMKDDIMEHIAFTEWQYINFKDNRDLLDKLGNSKKTLVSSSAQLAEHKYGKTQEENDKIEEVAEYDYISYLMKNLETLKKCNFDAVVVDEAHHGANSTLFNTLMDELNIHDRIYVSGTAMRYNGDQRFNEENTFSYDYVDECNDSDPAAKKMPRINLVTYEMNESVVNWAKEYYMEEEYFKFRKMWAVNNKGEFIHQAWVDNTLDMVLGRDGNPKAIANSPYYKYKIEDSLWVMPYDVKAINAVAKRIEERYGDEYIVINGAGSNGIKSADDIKEKIKIAKNGYRKKTIALTCVRFLAGVSIADWNGVFMMDDSTSIVRYIQALYRAQTPKPGKTECYVFDFCPQRFLAVVHEYAYSRMYGTKHVSPSEIIRELFDCMPLFRHGNNWELIENEPTLAEIFDANKLYFKGYDKYAGKCSLSDKWDTEDTVNLPKFMTSDSKGKKDVKGIQVTDGGVDGGKSFKPVEKGSGSANGANIKPDQEKERKKLIENCQEMLRRLPEYIYLTDTKELTMADVFANLDEDLFEVTTKNDPNLFRWAWDNGYFNKKSLDHMVVRINAEEAELERIKEECGFSEYRKKWDSFTKSWFYRPESSEIGMTIKLADEMVHKLFHSEK